MLASIAALGLDLFFWITCGTWTIRLMLIRLVIAGSTTPTNYIGMIIAAAGLAVEGSLLHGRFALSIAHVLFFYAVISQYEKVFRRCIVIQIPVFLSVFFAIEHVMLRLTPLHSTVEKILVNLVIIAFLVCVQGSRAYDTRVS